MVPESPTAGGVVRIWERRSPKASLFGSGFRQQKDKHKTSGSVSSAKNRVFE